MGSDLEELLNGAKTVISKKDICDKTPEQVYTLFYDASLAAAWKKSFADWTTLKATMASTLPSALSSPLSELLANSEFKHACSALRLGTIDPDKKKTFLDFMAYQFVGAILRAYPENFKDTRTDYDSKWSGIEATYLAKKGGSRRNYKRKSSRKCIKRKSRRTHKRTA